MIPRRMVIVCALILVSSSAMAVSTVGLVAHWPMDATGTDVSGNGNDLSVIGASPGVDRFGTPSNALELDAAASSLSLPDGPATDLVSQFTWLGWVRFDRIGIAADGFVAKSCCSSNTTTMFYADTYAWDGSRPNYNQIRFFVTAGGGNFGFEHAGPVLQNHTWYHIGLVYDGPSQTMKVYVNGALTDSLTNTGAGGIRDVPSSLNNVDAPFAMGRAPDFGPGNGLQGALDDVWWFSRVLTDSEIAEIASIQTCAQDIQHLEAQVAALTAQVSALNIQNAALTQQLQTVNSAVDAIQNAFRLEFADSQFLISGSTSASRIQSLETAILSLNRGHQEALYKALGGK